ncbi:uncharacterized protein [Palaemon carinicauda]|uniref:uncharacterized protein isoform X2 n=1 Tax=Palaemon carinicauda TaxID=392227 RepID=UPI0035B5D6D1
MDHKSNEGKVLSMAVQGSNWRADHLKRMRDREEERMSEERTTKRRRVSLLTRRRTSLSSQGGGGIATFVGDLLGGLPSPPSPTYSSPPPSQTPMDLE